MPYLPILTYHRILDGAATRDRDPHRIAVSVKQFRSHMRFLKHWGYHSLSLDEYVPRLRENRRIPIRTFAITFDDAYKETLTTALPILQELGFTATVFAVADRLGNTNTWDDGQAALMTHEDLKVWRHAGFQVGAHTCTHVHLPDVDAGTARREISESRKKLEALLGEPIVTFAYPYGEVSTGVEEKVREAGFEAAFVTDRGPQDHFENFFRIRRVVIFPRTNLWQLLWKVQSWYPAYQNLKSQKKK